MSAPAQSSPNFKVLLVLPYEPAAFMQTDIGILGRHFDLHVIVHNRGKLRLALTVLRRLLLHRPEVLLMWFIVPSYALALTALAKVFGVRVAFFTGGYDIVSMPGIGFGAMRFPLFRFLIKPTLALADAVFPFSESAARNLRKYARPRRSTVIYPSVDVGFFTPDPERDREPMAVTVSPVIESSIVQKGLKTFVAAASYAPGMRWVLVGNSPDGSLDSLRQIASPNVEFIDRFIPAEELRDLYRGASCYVQASVHEGFGIAVAEAMACGAVPVVTKRFSLPEVTGGLGEYIPLNDPQATAAAALRTLIVPPQQRQKMRARIADNYPLGRRERELTEAVWELVSPNKWPSL